MCLKTLLFCCLVTLVVCFICDSEALDETGDGVCIVRLSTRQRRRKTFNVQLNQWCGRKKCISKRYKTETYLIWTNHTVCCHGYKHNSDLDICSPICSTGCSGGRCIGPDRCYCDPPSYLDPELKNTCITPTCTPSCTNAVCHANNTCVCKENFSAYNSTHCFQCDVGYTPDESLNCFPVCSQCINSECVAPSVCQCLEGYKPKNDHVCEPVCDCVNAVCVKPHTCECLEGYIPLNDTTCVPKCDNCSNGDCIAPNTCSCREGYELIDGVCKPKCSVCENGFCTAPEVCTCNVGYHKTSEGVCVKPCDSCEGYCDDGKCVKWNCSSTPIKFRNKFPKLCITKSAAWSFGGIPSEGSLEVLF